MFNEITARPALPGDYDPLDALPAASRLKLERMQDRSATLHAGLMRRVDQRNEAQTTLYAAQQRLARLEASRAPADALEELRAKVGRLTQKRNRESDAHDVAQADWSAAARVEHMLTRYVEKTLMGRPVKAGPDVAASPQKGETVKDAIERVRCEVYDINREIKRIANAPYPTTEVLAKLNATVDALAEHGRPDVRFTVEHMEQPRWPEAPLHVFRGQRDPNGGMGQDAVALLAWLNPEGLKAGLQREVEAIAREADAVPAADRPKLLADLRAKRLRMERIEESLIERAEADGLTVPRREEADVRAILGIADDAPMPRE